MIMSLTDNKFKNTLLILNKEISERLKKSEDIMYSCVKSKLQNTLTMYESELEGTCNYILIRNPVVISHNLSLLDREENKHD